MSRTGEILIALCSFAGSLFAQASPAADSVRDQQAQPVRLSSHDYAGDETCSSCHAQQANAFLHTAHHLTSQLADRNSIAGNFREGTNLLRTSNPELFFKMEANERGLFQTAVSGTPPDTSSRSERFDLVVGSGGKGQTYLYWRGEELFQLPVTYWTELRQWVNSPGYKDGIADFSRRIPPRCLDCHATYFESLSPPLNRYRRDGFKLGIACEKCHGAGREHVAEEISKKPIATISMVNPRKLSRERQMDLCALCHAGIG